MLHHSEGFLRGTIGRSAAGTVAEPTCEHMQPLGEISRSSATGEFSGLASPIDLAILVRMVM